MGESRSLLRLVRERRKAMYELKAKQKTRGEWEAKKTRA